MERGNNIQTSSRKAEMIALLLTGGLCAARKRRTRPGILGKHGILGGGCHD